MQEPSDTPGSWSIAAVVECAWATRAGSVPTSRMPAELGFLVDNCVLPQSGLGRLDLTTSEPRAGQSWTNNGGPRDERGLKHRSTAEVRSVPIPPVLVSILRDHIDTYGVGQSAECSDGQEQAANGRIARALEDGGV